MHYRDDGGWVENLTALVEHHDGRLDIIDRSARWVAVRVRSVEPEPATTLLPQPVLGAA